MAKHKRIYEIDWPESDAAIWADERADGAIVFVIMETGTRAEITMPREAALTFARAILNNLTLAR